MPSLKHLSGARRRGNARFVNDSRGNAAIEFAMILPVAVLMIAGLIEFGLVTNTRTALENGARAGAQYALLNGYSQAAIQNTVIASTDVSLTAANVNVTQFYECTGAWGTPVAADTACSGGAALAKFVGVTATTTYTPFFPLVDLVLPTQLQGSATVRTP